MNNDRTTLRRVTLKNGKTGYFHRWSDHLSYRDGKQEPSAIIELEDGTVIFAATETIKFDPSTESERRMADLMRYIELGR